MDAPTSIPSADLNAVLKTALDAVVVMRLDGTVAGWNDVATRTFGWTFEEAEGLRMGDLIVPPQYREAHERGLAHYLATGEGPVLDRHIEIEAMHRDGHSLPIELSITPTDQFGEKVFLGFLRDISERHAAQRRQALMMAELNHRVKNMLAVVAGIAHQTARTSSSLDTFRASFAGRLDALARGYEMLSWREWDVADLGELVESLVGPYASGEAPRASFDGPPVALDARQVLSLSMIFHELITNAAKYGALTQAGGHIDVAWKREAEGAPVQIIWSESGLAGVKAPAKQGFGLNMIRMSASHELGPAVETEWRENGLQVRLQLPAPRAPREGEAG